MKIIEEVLSWDKSANTDCFGIVGKTNLDHIFPESLGGSSSQKNLQRISVEANEAKGNKTKGKIGNGWRFSVVKNKSAQGVITGIMYIRLDEWETDQWKKVIPVKKQKNNRLFAHCFFNVINYLIELWFVHKYVFSIFN